MKLRILLIAVATIGSLYSAENLDEHKARMSGYSNNVKNLEAFEKTHQNAMPLIEALENEHLIKYLGMEGMSAANFAVAVQGVISDNIFVQIAGQPQKLIKTTLTDLGIQPEEFVSYMVLRHFFDQN